MRQYSLPTLGETTNQVYPIRLIGTTIGDVTLPMPSDYKFELQKVYIEEPSRNNSGAIAVFPDKFFVPYFTVTWNVMLWNDYAQLMRLIQVDELQVEYYDTNEQTYKHSMFYVQQPSFNKLQTMQKQFKFVTNLQLVFAGTMNDIGTIDIEYNVNGGTGTVPSEQNLANGDEFIVNSGSTISRTNYVLDSWNTASDGSGERYELGAVAVATANLTLYAIWVQKESFAINLSYGYASGNATAGVESVSARYNVAVSGLPEDVIVCNSGTDDEVIDTYGNEVYTFLGWYALSQTDDPNNQSTKLSNGDLYPYQHDTIRYAHFSVNQYTLTFNSNGGSAVSNITAEFNSSITLPTPTRNGYTFEHWYYIVNEEEVTFSSATMPYTNLTLYASWTEKILQITLNAGSATQTGTSVIYEKYNTGWYSDSSASSSISTITPPTRTGYTFGGYFTGTNGTGVQIINASGNILAENTLFTTNKTLYARWDSV